MYFPVYRVTGKLCSEWEGSMTLAKDRTETGWRHAAQRVGLRLADVERELGRALTELERDQLEDAQLADLADRNRDQPSIGFDEYLRRHGLDGTAPKRR